MRALALCHRLDKALRLARSIEPDARGVEFFSLVANNRRWRSGVFVGAIAFDLLMSGPPGWFLFARALARGNLRISLRTVEDPTLLAWIEVLHPDVGLHATSSIYRPALLELFRLGILNPHIGLLPKYRGRSVMEWSLLNGDPVGISTFFVDEGIDTGPRIVLNEVVDVSALPDASAAKRHLFGQDGVMFAKALDLLVDPGFQPALQDPSQGLRWYPMSRVFTAVVDQVLQLARPNR